MSTGIKTVANHYDIITCVTFFCSFYVPSSRVMAKAQKSRIIELKETLLLHSSRRCDSFSCGYKELLKLQAHDSEAMESQGWFNVLKTKRSLFSLWVTSNPQLLSSLARQCLDPVTYHKWSLTQSLPALYAAPSEKHLRTLFDKLIAKWAISWRGFQIASRKPSEAAEEKCLQMQSSNYKGRKNPCYQCSREGEGTSVGKGVERWP